MSIFLFLWYIFIIMTCKLKCDVCKDDFESHDPNLIACDMCQRIINKYKKKTNYNTQSVRIALSDAYSHKDSENVYFKCFYTGIVGKFNESEETVGHFEDPFVLTLDHEYSKENRVVVSLNLINKMKGNIPPKEFKQIVTALGDYFKRENEDKTKASNNLEKKLRSICNWCIDF